ncbi:MAG: glycosyltransferase [Weeksellaceae bacterium]|nr:glycosyltransferase [Weeksellaceae bacterium]
MQNLAPIVLFCYNRPDHAAKTLEALSQNDLAAESILYIFCDGAKPDATAEQIEKIQKTRAVAKSKQWCKEVYIKERDTNIGLADSIIEGVTSIVNQYGKVIVLEDDIVTSRGFLKYMNDALDLYENNEKVMHISGYMYPHQEKLPETFFFNVTLCWGWATWKRAWNFFESNPVVLWNRVLNESSWHDFNRLGYDYLQIQLAHNILGIKKTWFIKWHASLLLQKGFSLFPNQSLVQNIGFDTTGEHRESNEGSYKVDVAHSIDVQPINVKESEIAERAIKSFYHELYYTGKSRQTIGRSQLFRIKKIIPLALKVRLRKLYNIYQSENIRGKENVTLRQVYQGKHTKLYPGSQIHNSIIGNYTYVAHNAFVNNTIIGRFCSIGPNFMCGRGIHPTNGLSTAPMFYSTSKQNGITLSETNKINEHLNITIGNDVFIGANVTVLDGVTIGDGAVIGAGSVVSKNIPPYSVAVGSPIVIKKLRFSEDIVENLLRIKWWNFSDDQLKLVEQYFFDIEGFINKMINNEKDGLQS